MKISVCLTAYRIPQKRIEAFLQWSVLALLDHKASLFLVLDNTFETHEVSWLHPLVYPAPLPVFNLAKTSNYAIRTALEAGADTILKTDVDCILTTDLLAEISSKVTPGRGLVANYSMIQTPEERPGKQHPQLCGTTALAASDWARICGYRETMDGYGWEDADLNDRASRQGIDMRRAHHPVYHVAHDPDAPQLGSARNDQWNRANGFNPMRRAENIRKRKQPWADFDWGKP